MKNASRSRDADVPVHAPVAHRLRDLCAQWSPDAPLDHITLGAVVWTAVCYVSRWGRHLVALLADAPRHMPEGVAVRLNGGAAVAALAPRVSGGAATPLDVSVLASWLDGCSCVAPYAVVASVVVPVAPLASYLRAIEASGLAFLSRDERPDLARVRSPRHAYLTLRGAGWVVMLEEAATPAPRGAPVFRGLAHLAACQRCGAEIASGATRAIDDALAIMAEARHDGAGIWTCRACIGMPPRRRPGPVPHTRQTAHSGEVTP